MGRVDYNSHNFTIDWHAALGLCFNYLIMNVPEGGGKSFVMRDSCKSKESFVVRQRNFNHDKVKIRERKSGGSSAFW